MNELETALGEIRRAREYTEEVVARVPDDEWFRQPAEGVTHVAWQVGHLAFAQYVLALERTRGPRDEDERLIPDAFRRRFGSNSVPDPDPAANPSRDELLDVFRRVHRQVLAEGAVLTPDDLGQPPLRPHRLCRTKLECLFWSARHEMLHGGQIGLLRRLLGHQPMW